MADGNPYEAPSSKVGDVGQASKVMIEDVRSGQKMIIYAILVSLAAVLLRVLGIAVLVGLLVQIGATVAAVLGILRLARGMGWSVLIRILLVVLSFIPLLGLLMLLIVNSRATSALRAAGYKVGLMGASK